MYQDLCISVNPLVKFLICFRHVVNIDIVGDDKAWLGTTGDDQIA